MTGNGKQRRIPAGRACGQAIANNPRARQAVDELRKLAQRIQTKGAAVGKVLTALRGVFVVLDQHAVAEFAEPRAAPDRTVADLAERMQDSLQAASAGLAERRFDPPQSLKDWEHLAAIIEKAPDR